MQEKQRKSPQENYLKKILKKIKMITLMKICIYEQNLWKFYNASLQFSKMEHKAIDIF